MEEKIIACEYCRWARDEMNWKYCPDCGLPTDPLSAFKKVEISPSQPSEQKPPEGGSDLRIIIRNTLGRVYDRKFPTTREEKDIEYATNILTDAMQEFAQQSRQQARNEAIHECIDKVNKYWSFNNIQAHTHSWNDKQDCLKELETLKHNP